jgi:hypothetical protein
MQSKIAKVLATLSAFVNALAAMVIDLLTHTHAQNPDWPPHARYHAAMFGFTSIGVAGVVTWLSWAKPGTAPSDRLRTARTVTALLGCLWAVFFIGLLVPGTSAVTPETAMPFGIPANILSGVLALVALPITYVLEARAVAAGGSLRPAG